MGSSLRRALVAGGLALVSSGCQVGTTGTGDGVSAGGTVTVSAAGGSGGSSAGNEAGGTSAKGGQGGVATGGHGGLPGAGGSAGSGMIVFPCSTGRADCDGNSTNGCETDTQTSAADCGACGKACPAEAHEAASCVNSVCRTSCDTGFGDCDGDAKNGCETDLSTATADCGACGKACGDAANAKGVCSASKCGIECATGFGDCDGNPKNGCETDTTASSLHCGTCQTSCPTQANGQPSCVASACTTICNAGFDDCDGVAGNGCETDITASAADCGACGKACAGAANATATCVAATCGTTCLPGFKDCNGQPADGCEADLSSDATACGMCGNVCGTSNALASCAAGVCVEACGVGFGNCDGMATNGCETDLTATVASCGGCGMACDATNGTPSCASSTCSIACGNGFGNCDGKASNGCETTFATSTTSCGACGHACGTSHAAAACTAGACAFACDAGYEHCSTNDASGCETDVANGLATCGSCSHVCGAANGTPSCNGGKCAFACAAGHAHCSSNDATGCETLTAGGDTQNCGACGHQCGNVQGTATCSVGKCVFACTSGYAHCGSNDALGCDTNIATAAACGSCTHVCGAANGTPSCTGSTCSFVCATGFAHCGSDDSTGCATTIATDPKNCGACGHDCRGGTCVASQCQPVVVSAMESAPGDIAVDASGLYWLDQGTLAAGAYTNGSVRALPAGMTIPSSLATNQAWPTRLALDSSFVYWTDRGTSAMTFLDGSLSRAAKVGATLAILVPSLNSPYGIAVSSTLIYWTSNGADGLGEAKLDGTSPAPFSNSDPGPMTLTLQGTTLLWSVSGSAIDYVPTTGVGEAVFEAGTANVDVVTSDASGVYWVEGGTSPTFADGGVYRASLDGTSVTAYVTVAKAPHDVAVDPTYVYWTEQGTPPTFTDGAIRRALKNGTGAAETLLSGLAQPFAITVDGTFLYYTELGTTPTNGAVMKVAK